MSMRQLHVLRTSYRPKGPRDVHINPKSTAEFGCAVPVVLRKPFGRPPNAITPSRNKRDHHASPFVVSPSLRSRPTGAFHTSNQLCILKFVSSYLGHGLQTSCDSLKAPFLSIKRCCTRLWSLWHAWILLFPFTQRDHYLIKALRFLQATLAWIVHGQRTAHLPVPNALEHGLSATLLEQGVKSC